MNSSSILNVLKRALNQLYTWTMDHLSILLHVFIIAILFVQFSIYFEYLFRSFEAIDEFRQSVNSSLIRRSFDVDLLVQQYEVSIAINTRDSNFYIFIIVSLRTLIGQFAIYQANRALSILYLFLTTLDILLQLDHPLLGCLNLVAFIGFVVFIWQLGQKKEPKKLEKEKQADQDRVVQKQKEMV